MRIGYYNKEKFDKYGLDPPRTWEELREVARVFHEKEGVGRVAIAGFPGPPTSSTVYEFVRAAGGDLNPLTLKDHRSREAFAFLEGLEPDLAPQYVDTKFDTANEFLIDDQVYLVRNWTFGIKVVIFDAGKKEINVYPGWEGTEGELHVLGGDLLAVPNGAPHPELAVKLIELLLSQEIQERLVAKLRWPPMRLDAYGTVEPEMKPYFEAVRDALAASEARPNVPQWAVVEGILFDAFQGLVINEEDISALKGYAQRMEEEVPSSYIRYQVEKDDTMESLAERFRTTVDMLAKVNDIPTWTSICPGQILLVPAQRITSQPSADGSLPVTP